MNLLTQFWINLRMALRMLPRKLARVFRDKTRAPSYGGW
jgi:hypothetical protein